MIIEPTVPNVLNGTQLKVSGCVNGTRFENSKGDVAVLPDWKLNWLKTWGYSEPVEVHGEPGFSELCAWVGCATKTAVVAFTNPGKSCAAVLFTDGTITDGLLCVFDNLTFSLA